MVNLSLGCAQFGMNYGYTNTRGKVNQDEVGEIIDLAIKNNIKCFDTAQAYGNSEQIISMATNEPEYFSISSKLLLIG